MARIVHQRHLQSQQVAHKAREKDGTVLAVAVGIIQRLLGEESTVAAPHLVVILIHQSRLHPVKEPLRGFQRRQALQPRSQGGIQRLGRGARERSLGAYGPLRHRVVVHGRRRIAVVELHELLRHAGRGHYVGIALRLYLPRLRHAAAKVLLLRDQKRQRLLALEAHGAYPQRLGLGAVGIQAEAVDVEIRRVEHRMAAAVEQHKAAAVVNGETHLIARLAEQERRHEQAGVGIATILAPQAVEKLQICPVAEPVAQARLEAVAQRIVHTGRTQGVPVARQPVGSHLPSSAQFCLRRHAHAAAQTVEIKLKPVRLGRRLPHGRHGHGLRRLLDDGHLARRHLHGLDRRRIAVVYYRRHTLVLVARRHSRPCAIVLPHRLQEFGILRVALAPERVVALVHAAPECLVLLCRRLRADNDGRQHGDRKRGKTDIHGVIICGYLRFPLQSPSAPGPECCRS